MERDKGCIFCRMGYDFPLGEPHGGYEAMHYIPRSRQGLGKEWNLAIGCSRHHAMMDQNEGGRRREMLSLFREYLESWYVDWSEEMCYYDKWGEVFGQQQAKRCKRREMVCADDAGFWF